MLYSIQLLKEKKNFFLNTNYYSVKTQFIIELLHNTFF